VSAPFKVVLPASADREEWLNKRRDGLGSSDIPDVMGVGIKTGQHVYYNKRGDLPDEEDAGEAALWGSLDEETTAREWARRNRSVIRRIGIVARVDEPWMMCTLDRRVTECPLPENRKQGVREQCALEVKHRNAFVAGKWRRDVPDDVLAQVLWQIAVTGYDHIHVACRIGGIDYRQYVVRRAGNEQLIGDIITVARALWVDNILAGRVPPHTGEEDPDALVDLYGRLHPDRSGVVQLDADPATSVAVMEKLREYEEHRLTEKVAKRRKEATKAGLLERLGDNELAAIHGEEAFSYPESFRRTVDLELLAEGFPQAYDACVTETSSRRLVIGRSFRLTEEDLNVVSA
jgi:putative phage-type endonuclease